MRTQQTLHGHRSRRCHGVAAAALLLLSLLFSAEAQSSSSSSPGAYPNGWSGGRFNPAMAVIIVVLISAFFFMGFFSIYIRQCSERADPSIRPAGLPGGRSRRAAAPRGLDAALIETFPTLVYADVKEHKIGKGALECAVCLCEFDDDDTLRLLPKCDHVFHPDCIDAWLSAHTTCPVCRANLALDPHPPAAVATATDAPAAGDASAAVADAGGDERQREGPDDLAPPDHVAIAIDEPAAAEASAAPPPVAERVVRVESKSRVPWRTRSLVRVPRFPRSHSTGHSMAVVRPGEDCERYTLRLPEHIRRDIMTGQLQRSSSCAVFPAAGEGSTRKGAYGGGGGEGSSRGVGGSIGGRSFKLKRWDWMAKSDRWAFFTRTFSMRLSRGEAAAEGSMRRGEGSTRRGVDGGGDAVGEGSFKAKVFPGVRSPFDCLGGGADGRGEEAAAGAPAAKAAGASQV